ncbi:hypothetical protein MX054_002358 [Enterobacter cloacae]|uniref:hypothetical protein n=1 Tax=Enterobacter TaxID=547 RepID=UPI000B021833|nr:MULTISPECIES: hypothetical protein [Enterobacter]EJC0565554.1 hypothetical protein [Enterobacter cloacae]
MKYIFILLSCVSLTLIFLPSGYAAEVVVNAEFKPSAANPDVVDFTNITPSTGFCVGDRAKTCPEGTFSIDTGIEVENKILRGTGGILREQTFQKVKSNWQYVTLTDAETGKTIILQFRITLLGQRFYHRDKGLLNKLNGAGALPGGGCTGTQGWALSDGSSYRFAWLHPDRASSTCNRAPVSSLDLDNVNIDEVSIGYELRSIASPLTLPNGNYSGGFQYTVGKDKDIDLGEGTYNDTYLQVYINAEIKHDFKASIQGSNSIELIPPGGWRSWSNSSKPQFRLEGTGQILMTASSPVSITAYCTHEQLKSCALKREGGDETVAVDINFSMPGVHERDTGESVTRVAIPITTPATPGVIIEPDNYLNNVTGQVHFTVNEVESLKMASHPGSTWKGSATLVFDVDIPFLPDP